jgi:hypothetical protein
MEQPSLYPVQLATNLELSIGIVGSDLRLHVAPPIPGPSGPLDPNPRRIPASVGTEYHDVANRSTGNL